MSIAHQSDGEVHFSLKYGDGVLEASLPYRNWAFSIEPQPVAPIADLALAFASTIDRPINAPPLREIIKPSDRVTIVTSDITRLAARCDLILPLLLSQLYECGVKDENVTILLGVGTHRSHTEQERARIVGWEALRRHKVVDHNCFDDESNVYLGTTSRGTPVRINRLVVSADKVILTGGIDFHGLAGFSAGRKALCPGVAGIDTIQANHKLALGDQPGNPFNPQCGAGRLNGNPVAEDMDEIAAMVAPHFIVNTIVDQDGQIVELVAGHWRDAFLAGCERVRSLFTVPIPRKADAVIVSCGGFPKDIDMWQSAKAVHAAASVVKAGGSIVLVAEGRDGAGNPELERWFSYGSVEAIGETLRREFHLPGYVAMRLLYEITRHDIYIVSSISDDLAQLMRLRKVRSIGEGIDCVRAAQGDDVQFALMPCGKASLPILASG